MQKPVIHRISLNLAGGKGVRQKDVPGSGGPWKSLEGGDFGVIRYKIVKSMNVIVKSKIIRLSYIFIGVDLRLFWWVWVQN